MMYRKGFSGDCLSCSFPQKYQDLYQEKEELIKQRDMLWQERKESKDRLFTTENKLEKTKEALKRFCEISKSDFPVSLDYWVKFFDSVYLKN